MIASFCQAYPEVEVEIAASEELVDLAAGGFDAGIRLGQFIAGDMVAVRLTSPFPLVVVGSPDYLRRRKRPERIDDLRGHACVRMRRSNGSIAPWPFVDGNKTVEAIVSGPLIAHDYPHSSERRSKAWDLRRCQPRSLEPRLPMADYKRYSLPSPSQRRGFFYITQTDVRSCPSCARSWSTSNIGALKPYTTKQLGGGRESLMAQTTPDDVLEAARRTGGHPGRPTIID